MNTSYIKSILLLLLYLTGNCLVSFSQTVPENNSSEKKITVFTIGDSTMANKKEEVFPETGWCQVFHLFVNESVIVKNRAKNGRSSKSFINEGRWDEILDSLSKDDYVFIQFGHNDQKSGNIKLYAEPFTTYRKNLVKFVTEALEKGANPILFTPIVRRKFENGFLTDTNGDYPLVVRKLAYEMNVPLVDLQLLTIGLVTALGEDASKEIFLWTEPNDKFPEGRKDDTHLSLKGANLVAKLAVQQLLLLDNSLSKRIN